MTLQGLPRLLAVIIFFSSLSAAACPRGPHQTGLAGYALSPDATRIAAIAEDGALFWWDVATGKRTELMECATPEAFDHPILFSPDSARLAVALENGVHIFDLSTGNVVARLTTSNLKNIYSIVFSGDGWRLAASYEGGAVVWNIANRSEIASIAGGPSREALALNLDGTLLVLGSWDGLELWTVSAKSAVRRFAQGTHVESVLFAHQDQWIIALTATVLPPQPLQRVQKYKREIAVWDTATGNKLKTFKADDELDELRFGLAPGGPHQLLATDFKDRLRAWDLDSGELKATWETTSGHPSADGKFLLREGGVPGRLELWEIGSPDEQARPFVYRSPLCAENFADGKGNVHFEELFIADGMSGDDEPFGSLATLGYVAQDCTRVNFSRLSFKTQERAREAFDRMVAQALEVIEKGPPKDAWWQALLGERRVLRLVKQGPGLGPFAIIWLQETSLLEITSSSLPVALALEKQTFEKKKK